MAKSNDLVVRIWIRVNGPEIEVEIKDLVSRSFLHFHQK